MNRFKSVIVGSLLAGCLISSTGAVWANHKNRRDIERDRARLEQLIQKREYDARHGASRKKLAAQTREIERLQQQLDRDRHVRRTHR
jgi:hypothetical protein